MFPHFVHPLLLSGLALAVLPVLIHLINMLRHRRVEWAAMEFLEASYKKHRTWVIFKQLLLMLLRIVIVGAIVLMVAQPLWEGQLSRLLGGIKTHHIILLDDSFSMSDRWAETTAFDEAKRVVEKIGIEGAERRQSQLFTLLRFSQVGRQREATHADFLRDSVQNGFKEKLIETLKKMQPSQTDVGPLEPLKALDEILGEADGERRVLTIVTDFRARQWNDPADIKKELLAWQATGGDIHLVNAVDTMHPNLAVVALEPEEGLRAAGVPWFMQVSVTNYGKSPAKDVSVILGEDGRARPSVAIAEIPPGRTVKERFQVIFPDAGWHEIAARIEGDAVATDNHRYYALELPSEVKTLLIDGDTSSREAKFLEMLFAPGGAVRTGLKPVIESPRFLNQKPLDGFAAIILTNIDRLDPAAVVALEKYAAQGGGVAFFLGDKTQPRFMNEQLYRDGKGLFPLSLKGQAELQVDRLEKTPDVQTEKHFLFRIYSEKRNNFLQALAVQRYFTADEKAGDQPTSQKENAQPQDGKNPAHVIARLRNGSALVVEKEFGRGRVVAFLTTAAPSWNNWARNPGVVVFLDLQAYLSRRVVEDDVLFVGTPLNLYLDPAKYQSQVRFVGPDGSTTPGATIEAATNEDGKLFAQLRETDTSGFYEARLTRTDNSAEVRRYAYNVEPSEGNLGVIEPTHLAERLKGVNYKYFPAAIYQTTQEEQTGHNLGEVVLFVLIGLLIAEQALAYSASYHPQYRVPAMSAGGRR